MRGALFYFLVLLNVNLRSLLIVNDFGGEYKRIDSTQSHRIGPPRGKKDSKLKRYT